MFHFIVFEYITLITLGMIISYLFNVVKELRKRNRSSKNEITSITTNYESLVQLITSSINLVGVFYFEDFDVNLVMCSKPWVEYYGTFTEFKHNHTKVYLKILQYQETLKRQQQVEYNVETLKEKIVYKNNKVYLKLHLSPWLLENKVIGIVVEGVDITECVTNKTQKDSLDGISSTILSITAHQLKNRIRKLYLVMEDKSFYSDSTPCGNCAVKGVVKDLDMLVDDLVSLGGIYHVVKSNSESTVKVREYIENIIKLSDYKEEQVEIEIKGEEEIEVKNRRLLEDVILELLVNAWKYRDIEKEVKLVFTVEIEDRLNYKIKIWDNGLGISEKELDFIQTPYFRGAPFKRGIPGSGLGLVFTKLALEAMGMTFSIHSSLTEFTEVILVRKNG